MGADPEAHLAYGYDLGTSEDYKVAEQSGYAELALDWFDNGEDEDDAPAGFTEQAFDRLYAVMPDPPACEYDWQRQAVAEEFYGVTIVYSGGDEIPGFILVAAGSERSVEWSDAMTLDLDELRNGPGVNGWDAKLAAVIDALGITPTQDGPRWLVFPSYG